LGRPLSEQGCKRKKESNEILNGGERESAKFSSREKNLSKRTQTREERESLLQKRGERPGGEKKRQTFLLNNTVQKVFSERSPFRLTDRGK